MAQTRTLINPGFRIPIKIHAKIDKAWARRRVKGVKETKQAFVADLLEAGLQSLSGAR